MEIKVIVSTSKKEIELTIEEFIELVNKLKKLFDNNSVCVPSVFDNSSLFKRLDSTADPWSHLQSVTICADNQTGIYG